MLGPFLQLPAPPADGDSGPLPLAQVPPDSQPQETNELPSAPAPVATHTRTIGIIHPPPDIRLIIDKTANFVAKNGPEFEKRILANNAKLNFIITTDPYHAYYQHRISEFRSQLQSASDPSQPSEPTTSC